MKRMLTLPLKRRHIILAIAVMLGLYGASLYDYLLFHSLAEIFSIIVACGIFMITWNARHYLDDNYILFIGIGFLFVGGFDLIHMLSYEGMNIFKGYHANLPTQMWICARYIEAASFLIAPFFMGRKLRRAHVFLGFCAVTAFLLAAVFYWHIFPRCYITGVGLTPFKKASEYVICVMLVIAGLLLYRRREHFDHGVFSPIMLSILVTIVSEIAFTSYVNVYAIPNLIGHFLKIVAFYLFYKALVETALMKPYAVLFRNLKQSELALRKSEERYRLLFEGMIGGFALHEIIMDDHGRPEDYVFLDINPAFERITGLQGKEVIGRRVLEILPGTEDYWINTFGQVALTGKPAHFQNYSKGIGRYYEGNAFCPKRGQFAVTFTDVTERRQAEMALQKSRDELENRVRERTVELVDANKALQAEIAERKQAEKALRESEELLSTVLHTLPVGVWVADRRGRYHMGNAAGKQIWSGERKKDTAQGASCEYGREDTGKPLQPDPCLVTRAIENGETSLNEVIEIECLDGTHKIILNSAVPIRNAEHEIVAAIVVNEDITEQKQADEERELYTKKLEWSNRELQEFAFVASHDLQEPLRKVMVFGDLLEEEYKERLDPKGADYIERMRHAAERMQGLIRGLLAYSRITAKAVPFQQVDLGRLAGEVLTDLETRVREMDAHVEIGVLPSIEADPYQMRQLFQNLIGNALKYHGNKDKPLIRIEARPVSFHAGKGRRRHNTHYEILVEDNGIGFDERYLDRIFKPFQRLHSRTDYEGTGIGLAICRKIVERHGGTITARSMPGEGSTFIMELPVKQDEMAKERNA